MLFKSKYFFVSIAMPISVLCIVTIAMISAVMSRDSNQLLSGNDALTEVVTDSYVTKAISTDDMYYEEPVLVYGEDMLLPHDLSDMMYESLYLFVDTYGYKMNYSTCEIIECVGSAPDGVYGVCIGIVFGDDRYVCIWVKEGFIDALKLYDTKLTERLIANWEYI